MGRGDGHMCVRASRCTCAAVNVEITRQLSQESLLSAADSGLLACVVGRKGLLHFTVYNPS